MQYIPRRHSIYHGFDTILKFEFNYSFLITAASPGYILRQRNPRIRGLHCNSWIALRALRWRNVYHGVAAILEFEDWVEAVVYIVPTQYTAGPVIIMAQSERFYATPNTLTCHP